MSGNAAGMGYGSSSVSGSVRASRPQAGIERAVTLIAADTITLPPIRTLGMTRLCVLATQSAGAVGATLTVQVKLQREWRTVGTIGPLVAGTPSLTTYNVDSRQARIGIAAPGANGVTVDLNFSASSSG